MEQMKGECDVLKEREKAKYKEYEDLKAKCEVVMVDFDNNLAVSLLTLELKIASLEPEKAKLETIEALLRQEIKSVRRDRDEVVSKVVPYVAMEIVQSYKMGRLVAKLVKGYRPTYKKEHIQASNNLVAATFPFLYEVVVDPFASVEALLSMKPRTLQRLAPTRTLAPAPSFEKATPSFAHSLKSAP
ncbi:hypothetical protein Tco_1124035 [Tanacetum coccineum]|uniref:FRIGIDA-like protein n=1 Tax=Tanacetum coccineum TaxID=301880 RepID=A0ABQ5J517_9ASTR